MVGLFKGVVIRRSKVSKVGGFKVNEVILSCLVVVLVLVVCLEFVKLIKFI